MKHHHQMLSRMLLFFGKLEQEIFDIIRHGGSKIFSRIGIKSRCFWIHLGLNEFPGWHQPDIQ